MAEWLGSGLQNRVLRFKSGRRLEETEELGNLYNCAQVAQSVEQRTENPRVGGSIPPLGTCYFQYLQVFPVFLVKIQRYKK